MKCVGTRAITQVCVDFRFEFVCIGLDWVSAFFWDSAFLLAPRPSTGSGESPACRRCPLHRDHGRTDGAERRCIVRVRVCVVHRVSFVCFSFVSAFVESN